MASWSASCWLALAWWCVAGAGAAAAGVPGLAGLLGEPASYDVDSTVLLNDVARKDKEVGYQIRATLDLLPVWADAPTDYLLKFRLRSPKLHLRGKHVNAAFLPYDSVWDLYSDSTFFAHWSHGLIKAAYLDPGELPDVLNYKKSLISLFQFQGLDGEHNETDVSGPCSVIYETLSLNVFRRIKRHCAADAAGAVRAARRVARYSLAPAALAADELLALGPAPLGLKARARHALAARPAPPAAPRAASLQDALRGMPAALRELPLELAPEAEAEAEPAEQELAEALKENRAALEGEGAGEGGGADAALAALRLLPPLRAANSSALLQLLHSPHLHDALPGLLRLLGLAGTRAAHAAAADFLQLRARDPLLDLAHTYLAAFALAERPDEGAVRELLRLGDEGRAAPVAESALLAGAAAARSAALAQHARDVLARGLARCRDERCRAVRLRALANLRADTADLLLQRARSASRAWSA